ncbi:MAG: protein kinase [Ktedonobacterales bacterium]|nr:protein kinase [Ktedonobacterales bacterium]
MTDRAGIHLDALGTIRSLDERPDAASWLMAAPDGRQFVRKTMPTPLLALRARNLFTERLTAVAAVTHLNLAPLAAGGIRRRTECFTLIPYAPHRSLLDALSLGDLRLWTLPLPPADAVRLVREIADGLQALHNGRILHGRLKLTNILLTVSLDGALHPQITDVLLHEGFAGTPLRTGKERPAGLVDPWLYLAPEAMEGHAELASDQYALCVIAFLLLTGDLPLVGDPAQVLRSRETPELRKASTLNPILPTAVDGVLWRALARTPRGRYPTVRGFAQALVEALGASRSTHHVALAPGSIPHPTARGDAVGIRELHESLPALTPLAVRSETPTSPIPGLPDLPPSYQWTDEVVSSYIPLVPPLPAAPPRRRRGNAALVVGLLVVALLIAALLVWLLVPGLPIHFGRG